jgi:hypothetical protein
MHQNNNTNALTTPTTRRLPRSLVAASVLGLALSLVACASAPPPPVAALSTARIALTQAEAAGAGELAPVELLSAREKLVRADQVVREERFAEARRLADESTVDAELAERSARAMRAQQAAAELRRSNATLEAEIDRPRQQALKSARPLPAYAAAPKTGQRTNPFHTGYPHEEHPPL